jgi:hypothetical protein
MTSQVPRPSDEVLLKLAGIATFARSLTAPDRPSEREPVGRLTLQNERRRAAEKILVLLADPELRDYLAQPGVTIETL